MKETFFHTPSLYAHVHARVHIICEKEILAIVIQSHTPKSIHTKAVLCS